MTVLLDAGPALNFLAVGQQNILVQLTTANGLQMAAPQRVDREVRGKCREIRFSKTGALGTWDKLCAASRIVILDDAVDKDDVFEAAVSRVGGAPAKDRIRDAKSLGEIMVIAHASVHAQVGQDVFVLIDEGDGRRRAQREARWLERHVVAGSLTLWSTVQVLQAAKQESGWIVNGLSAEQVYEKMRHFDDGLPHLQQAL